MGMICLLALLLNSSSSLAQDASPPVKKKVSVEVGFQMEMNFFPEGTFKFFSSNSFGKVVKGAPYSATAITEHVQTLSDGNQIIRKNEAKIYRDSEGRTRREQKLETIGKWTAAGDAPQMIYINDPVAGYSYNLDPRTRMARKGTNINRFEYRQKVDEVNERIKREIEERVKSDEERIKREKERVKRNEEQAKERAKRIEEQSKELAKRNEEQAKERAKRNEERVKERTEQMKEHEARMKEQTKEREARTKELTKEREAQEKERIKNREERVKEQKTQREKREKESIERSKRVEKQRKEIAKLRQEKKIAPDTAFKSKERTISKASSDANKKVEALGKQTIEGVEVEGTRSTRTIPTGEIGNTLPIEIVDENWYSPDLQVQVMTKHSDPRSGVTTYRLTNIRRSEPDRSLFEVPADFTFRDSTMPAKKVTKPEPAKKPEPAQKAEPAKKPEPAKPPVQFL
jgi:myosin heavy subunit